MNGPLLVARNLGKRYPRSADARARLSAFARILFGRPFPQWEVLKDISFAVEPGQSLGIVGENGAGKSTLLKLICGVLEPSSGSIERRGSIGALLELGAGFDLERTGRENIAISASLQGWSAAQVAERLEDIIAFADIGRYLDEPVKHYSSGMVVRLGFAIIAAVKPDLLITDEVLAVGDESFQKKCIRWIEDYLDGGGTLLLVSHSMYHVQKLCKQALWLRDGHVQAYGDVFEVTQDYLAFHERRALQEAGGDVDPDYAGAEYRIVAVRMDGDESAVPKTMSMDGRITLEVDMYSPDGRAPGLGVGLLRADGTAVFGSTSEMDGAKPVALDGRHFRFRVEYSDLALLPGGYFFRLHALDPESVRLFDTVERGFTVRGQSREFGLVRLPHRWS